MLGSVHKIYLSVLFLICGTTVCAQNFVVGSKIPPISGVEWLDSAPELKRRSVMIEFFSSVNRTSLSHVESLEALAAKYVDRLEIVVVTKDPLEMMEQIFSSVGLCHVALDAEGCLFDLYGVKFVPCTIIVNERNRIVWSGSPLLFTTEDAEKIIR